MPGSVGILNEEESEVDRPPYPSAFNRGPCEEILKMNDETYQYRGVPITKSTRSTFGSIRTQKYWNATVQTSDGTYSCFRRLHRGGSAAN